MPLLLAQKEGREETGSLSSPYHRKDTPYLRKGGDAIQDLLGRMIDFPLKPEKDGKKESQSLSLIPERH
jgi:hypothetical protein